METTYTQARARLASLCDHVTSTCESVIIRRRGSDDVALIAAAELSSLMATAHELRSPKNAERLLRALQRARLKKGRRQSPAALRRELGLEKAR